MNIIKAQDIMSNDLKCGFKTDSLYDISVIMSENNIGFVPILEDGKVIGVITDRDIVIRGIFKNAPLNSFAYNYMSTNIISVNLNSNLKEISFLLAKHQIKRILVIDNNKLYGIISLSDILRINNDSNKLLNVISTIFSI